VKVRSRFSQENPGREKPKGASGGGRAKHAAVSKGLSEGSKPRNRSLSGRFGAFATEIPSGLAVCGFFRPETVEYLSRGERSEG